MSFKTYTESSITLKKALTIAEKIESITLYYDAEFDEYRVQFYDLVENERWYLKTVTGHVKIFKTMKAVYKDIAAFVKDEDITVSLHFDV